VVVVRPSVAGDIAELQAVEVDAGQLFRAVGLDSVADDDPPDAADLAAHIAAGTAWTAMLDSLVVGYAVASVVDGEGHLDQVSVRRSAAGRGIGRLLIDQVCRWAAAQGHHAVTLTTFAEVAWNGPYYRRLGFAPIDDTDCGPELQAIRARERRAGIEVSPRIAMRLDLDPDRG
jgi:GNAT superfamily N-acetyltransferase